MKLFLDTEFTGLHKNTTLISIALVSERGDYFYAECSDYDQSQLNPWLIENVIANLTLQKGIPQYAIQKQGNNLKCFSDKTDISIELKLWLEKYVHKIHEESISKSNNDVVYEIWSDVGSYDWILFQDLFGGAFEMPKTIYYIPFDIAGKFKELNLDPDHNREIFLLNNGIVLPGYLGKHNALYDAMQTKVCYEILEQKYRDIIAGVQTQSYEEGFNAGMDNYRNIQNG